MKNRALKTFGIAAAVLGATVFTAGPAAAAGAWQSVSTNSNWDCDDYVAHKLSVNIKFKTCVVRNANNDAQGVLVVQNSGTKVANIRGEVTAGGYTPGGAFRHSHGTCKFADLLPGQTRGCFGYNVAGTVNLDVDTALWMNGSDSDVHLSRGSNNG
ncbi:hypothetical protein ACIPPS_12195 [Streptomyces sp. NPDC090127]|uniref:hypothetical protein n=1 Tax=Streptomyces sp. NPDC090127 TaxID=3365953 RepID=UPI00380ED982